jgi:S-(hydroxymethyl)glutathione dehydrogenase/alcohol dehydrogenase
MKTKAAILFKLNAPLQVAEIEIPKLQKGQLLVKILASGICHSQLNEIAGLRGPDKYLPHLLGHEGSGIVKEVGAGVTKVRRGDRVVLSWITGKGLDVPSAQYLLNNRVINSGAITTFSEYAVVSENRVCKIAKNISPTSAALLGCAVATGGGIVLHDLNISKNSSLAVFGVGGVGSGVILTAAMKNCRKIIAIDISSKKLEYAKKLGATNSVIFNKDKITEEINAICPGGVDFAVEASGVGMVMEKAFEAIKNTGLAVIAGNLRKGEKISINPFDLILGKRIIGTWGGRAEMDEDIPYYAKAYLDGSLKLDKLITRKFKLEQINQAFALMEKQESLGRMILEL